MPRCHVRTVGSVLLLLVIAVHRTIEARPSDGGFLRLDQEPPPADEKLGKKHKICDDLEWRKYALKLLKEMPVAGLFRDLMGISKFEVSGVTSAKGRLYTVFDSLHTIGVIDERFEFCSPNNALVGDPGEESQFEGITYRPSTGTFLAVRESQLDSKQGLHPHIVELSFKADMSDYEVVKECRVEFNLSHANKGFEGLHFYDAGEQGQYVFGLCEGNHCSGGKKGREAGNGRMVVLREEMHADGSCSWRHVKTVHVPPSAAFEDYSGLDFFGTQVGITSQQDSALWVGTFDFWHLEFEQGGSVFHFPRNSHCDRVYCNIEGLHWLDQQRFVVVSDRAKSDQPFVCVEKDQSVHTFMLPARDRASSLPPGRLPAS